MRRVESLLARKTRHRFCKALYFGGDDVEEGLTARRGHGKDSAWSESSTWLELANQLRNHDELETTLSLRIYNAYVI